MPSPYLPNTDADRRTMLREIGVGSIDELFEDIPEKVRHAEFKLPRPLSELELKKELSQLAGCNANLDNYACFLGAGSYRHFIPSTVEHVIGRSEFYTAYTPYQAEASQGTLQTTYEYQSLVCQLTGMEVSNAGMYDCSTAAAEAAIMACIITKRRKVAVSTTVNPTYRDVIGTYVKGRSLSIETIELGSTLSSDCACLVVQQPNFLGYLEEMEAHAQKAHDIGALFVAIVDPISLGMFKPPGQYGADVAVADGQPLGNPVSFGGPGLGIFACRREYLRQMPGRIVGRTVDVDGRPGYVMTLVTREQYIRRERATSNICTSEALMALAAAVYLATLGRKGLKHVAELCYHKAHYAAKRIAELKGYSLVFSKPFFREFAVRCPVAPSQINRALFNKGIIGGLDISGMIDNAMLLCVTEMNTKQEIDKLVEILRGF
ncbi:MAG: aminomethyl-transferring glycine dehydrogenase subunit GcvPA [Dehalococcoidia bacterium]|nr:aminomethyl-transferring glycine dehydrogenase subunit GcvPA [Dehalococcoidia bacterium]MDH4299394.1 aminomethyl-transferring glycine dehydrogenase subunit GcvPA [Dehalococcoidia bacterium]MDH4366983.1 aminomethyl-transferring glycine dehydrogenase subunit GcvPA [Dehalococcoidia bacterium]